MTGSPHRFHIIPKGFSYRLVEGEGANSVFVLEPSPVFSIVIDTDTAIFLENVLTMEVAQ